MHPEQPLLEEALARLTPPAPPGFLADVQRDARRAAARALRRRRHAVIAAGCAAAAVVAAGGVAAAPSFFSSPNGRTSIVDRTLSCRVERRSGTPAFDLLASIVTTTPHPMPAYVYFNSVAKIDRNKVISQVKVVAERGTTLVVDRTECRPSSRTVPLTPHGLERQPDLTRAFLGEFNDRCVSSPRALIRARLMLSGGTPVGARIAIRDDTRRSAPIVFLDWSRGRIVYAKSPRCVKYP